MQHKHGIRPEFIDKDVVKDEYLYEDVAQAFVSVAQELVQGIDHYCKRRVAFTKKDVRVGAVNY